MTRAIMKKGTQEHLSTMVPIVYMDALRQIKAKTNYLLADMVREALSMYVRERVTSGLIQVEDRTLPYKDWSGLVRSVAEVLEQYRWKATAEVREHGKEGGFGGDLTEWFYEEVRAALQEYDEAKERVGSNAKTVERAKVGEGK
ncbi:MAG: hypothetical protein WC291_11740 [Thermodesulfovibrionales bacterium]|jgi:hypothetical protein